MNVIHTPRQPTPRQRRRAENLERVIRTVMGLVRKQGLDGLTMHGIADALGWAVGNLYRYFPSKDALLVAVQRRVVEQIGDDLDRALATVRAGHGRSGPAAVALTELWVVVRVYQAQARVRPEAFGCSAPPSPIPGHW